MKATRNNSCQYCGSGIRRGMLIERATFSVREAGLRRYNMRNVTRYVHADCASAAQAEWPELNKEEE